MASGYGKIILFGEHGVVHGRPALALAVPGGAEATARPRTDGGPTRLTVAPWGVDVDTGTAPNLGREPLQRALQVACALYDDAFELELEAQVRLPSGAGMGSSAALGVAVLRAMDEARGQTRAAQDIYERSLAWEQVFHGNPSGVDNAMATFGGLALFRRGQPIKPVVPSRPIRVLAADSGEPSSTKEMVASVARQLQREPERVGKILDGMEAIVSNARLAVEQGDLRSLGQLMILNHKLLASLMLSTDQLEEMIEHAMSAGALGAKVTGAGGGGCMIALVDGDDAHASVRAALEALGKRVYDVEATR